MELIRTCKTLCGPYHRLKVILETGELADPELIRTACREAIAGGADFLKTSTGKAAVNATPEAVRVMLETIEEEGGKVGLKVSGGLRTLADAQGYRALVEERFGAGWVTRSICVSARRHCLTICCASWAPKPSPSPREATEPLALTQPGAGLECSPPAPRGTVARSSGRTFADLLRW